MGITQDFIDKSQTKVIADLKEKKLGNNTPAPDEPKGKIWEAVKDASLEINPKNGTIK